MATLVPAYLVLLLSVSGTYAYNQIRLTRVGSSSVYQSNKASLANDGDFTQNIQRCSHTDDKPNIKEAWLRLDLGDVFSMKSVKFWYRNDRGGANYSTIRLRGYSIRVSNDTTLPPPESSCYTDPGNVTLPTIIEKNCERTVRYVWIYQGNALEGDCPILEICEVQVFGCETGRYGEDCSYTCDHCRNNASCEITSGVCDKHGCADPKMAPPSCSQCLAGFGENCRRQCSPFCKENRCDINMGTCLLGCNDGYLGSFCNTTCRYGNYGDRCQKSCNHCLQNTTCHHVNGFCSSGCKEGYKGEKCDTACSVGEYGKNCANHCGHCFNNEPCNRFDGRCNDCETGYHGFKCDKECSNKTYGLNCLDTCGACLDSSPCHHVDGSCPSGCNPGWQTTPKCDAPCPPGTFGPNCINKCSGNCLHHAPCDKESGKCKSCSEGWKNDFCNEKSGEPITDLEKLTLQHLKLDNERLVIESEMLKKESQKISLETVFLKIKEKYLRLKMQSEFQKVMNSTPETQLSEENIGQSFGSDGQNATESP
uniref:Protein draper-like isoform X1 n=1 Tax=Crassostrea virginica TaxID=6565 RepID=A0A8B8C9W1_CRAVI|nr:protein draper-like isoform X1 [Crassostrea virginica]